MIVLTIGLYAGAASSDDSKADVLRDGELPAPLVAELIESKGPTYDGTACPWGKGGVSISVTPDGKTLSVLFDDFHTELTVGNKPAPGTKPPLVPNADRKFCEIRVPMKLPAGYALAVFNADYRGFAYIVGKTEGRITSSVRLGNAKRAVTAEHVLPATDEPTDYLFTHQLPESKDRRLICGETRPREVVIRVDLALLSQNTLGQTAMLTLDSADATALTKGDGVRYGLDWRPCPKPIRR